MVFPVGAHLAVKLLPDIFILPADSLFHQFTGSPAQLKPLLLDGLFNQCRGFLFPAGWDQADKLVGERGNS